MKSLHGLWIAAAFAVMAAGGSALADDANLPTTRPSAGDADSPTARLPSNWDERWAQYLEIVRSPIEELALKVVARANKRAKDYDDKTWLHSVTYHRVMYYVPDSTIPPWSDIEAASWNADLARKLNTPPAEAVQLRWQDRFALAQEYSYRYSFGGVTRLVRDANTGKPSEATLEFRIKGTHRGGLASDVQEVPAAPHGLVPWQSFCPRSRFFGRGFGLWCPCHKAFPTPSRPTIWNERHWQL